MLTIEIQLFTAGAPARNTDKKRINSEEEHFL